MELEKVLEQLQDMKFIEAEVDLYDQDLKLLENILKRLTINTDLKLENLEFTQNCFYSFAIRLLGYEGLEEKNIDFLKDKNLYLSEDEYKNIDLIKSLYSLLKTKTSDGIDFITDLANRGGFYDYNLDRDIPKILYFNGKTQPIFDYEKRIFEKVYVESPLDTDEDGNRDLLLTYIIRPMESEKGMKVPVIYVASPYMLGGDDDGYILHNIDNNLEIIEETDFEYEDIKFKGKKLRVPKRRKVVSKSKAKIINEQVEFEAITPWYKYFISRGYALVLAGGIGTRGSDGLRTCGSIEETISTISIIRWLNNNLNAFTSRKDNIAVEPYWTNGNVGMIGKSYLGTLAIAASTTGVKGLKTVVPEAAISNWYNYYRSNGLVSSALDWQGDDADLLAEYCLSRVFDSEDYEKIKDKFKAKKQEILEQSDRRTGNYNEFWDERNYLNKVKNIDSSVLIVHGLKDWNVKPRQFHDFWEKMKNYNIEKKMILHRGDHIYINDHATIDFTSYLHDWFDYYLYEKDNSVLDKYPNVLVQSNIDTKKWYSSGDWPFEDTHYKKLYISELGKIQRVQDNYSIILDIEDNLEKLNINREKIDEDRWVNDLLLNPMKKNTNRLVYLSDELDKDLIISGCPKVEFNLSCGSKTGIISAMLVDYGILNRPTLELNTVKKDAINLGINAGSMDSKDFKLEEKASEFEIITRESINIQNRKSIINKENIEEDKFYNYNIEMEPMFFKVPKGHKIGLVIYSTDLQLTQRPLEVTNFKIEQSSIILSLPVVNSI